MGQSRRFDGLVMTSGLPPAGIVTDAGHVLKLLKWWPKHTNELVAHATGSRLAPMSRGGPSGPTRG